jgi:outer membrane lipoprotein
MMRWSMLLAAVAVTAAGCAAGVPKAIREAPPTPVTPAQIRTGALEATAGQRVRWGGIILEVHNRERVTDIEILAYPLDSAGEPRTGASAEGRFIARVDRFVDPAEYPQERLLTVSGTFAGVETRPVGDYPYRFPVVDAEVLHLWPEPREVYPYPPWPYSWYDPWYPFYRPWYHPWYGW